MPDLASELETVVLAVPAVTTLYGTGSAVANVIGSVGGSAHRVSVGESADETTVTLSIGVDGSQPASTTAQLVDQVIRSHLRAAGVPAPVVHLTVAHVGSR